MANVLILACVIACPLMMGAMMLFMRRGRHGGARDEDGPEDEK